MQERADFDSTLIRRGRSALSVSEMVAFVETLEARPLIKLLEELPELARPSDAKFVLATKDAAAAVPRGDDPRSVTTAGGGE
ncbi:MAG: hypothetical protein AABO58_02015 [Acidobacteriota bacterium]